MSNKDHMKGFVLTPDVRVPIYVVGSAVLLAIYGTVLYTRLSDQIKSAVTVQQAQTWIDNARDANRVANPSVVWPRLPPKEEKSTELNLETLKSTPY